MAWAKPNTSAGRLWRVGPSAVVNCGRVSFWMSGEVQVLGPSVSVSGAPVEKLNSAHFLRAVCLAYRVQG